MKRIAIVVSSAALIVGCGRRQVVTAPPAVVVSTPKPATTERSKRARRAPAPTIPAAVVTPPVLESMRTPEEREIVVESINSSIDRAESNLTTLRLRKLGPEFARDVARVESFIRSARGARKANDLTTAREYAQRAEILSDDLLKR